MNEPLIDPREQSNTLLKQRLARQFGQAAKVYNDIAQVQLDIGFDGLQMLPQSGDSALDIGCGTGRLTRQLAHRFNKVFGIDLASGMIEVAKNDMGKTDNVQFSVADAEQLPFESGQFDCVFSSMALQWCIPIEASLGQVFSVLKPGGKAVLTILNDGSLNELKASWAQVDSIPRVNQFLSHAQIVKGARSAGFVVEDAQKTYVTWHANTRAVLNSVKKIGAGVLSDTGNKASLTRTTLAKLASAYESQYAINKHLPLTYQVSFLLLEKPR
ncbi:methyltransferase domain-containing protein [Aliiglaciecola sp. LCG003]|uniref:methyltransferase domain-containing protein n=1 Tax=Aliiglaciecola sp. LCG003 TaxID=3053655 RepID=UPI0025737784|nr:methyltransferase domain-containing protein [Aliiglaciecola sp. LCG003]WJG08055.1 methyltransferase domain-containing protein [Aliiglaciecola sp. LCG003]